MTLNKNKINKETKKNSIYTMYNIASRILGKEFERKMGI
jgi:hypothetical protein